MSGKEMATKARSRSGSNGNNMTGMTSGNVSGLLGKYKLQIAQAVPKHLSPERLIQMATVLITKNPKIAQCSQGSIIGAVLQASVLGFKPVQALGQCYFVPYGGQVQFQIGYKGYIDLARRSGQIKSLHAFCVYKGDDFKYELGLEPKLTHKPAEDVNHNADNLTHVYAVSHYKDGGYNFVVLTKNDVEKLRLRNPLYKNNKNLSGAWKTDYDKMAMAKAIKQLAKYMPMSDEFESATQSDDAIIKPENFAQDGSGQLTHIEYPEAEVVEEIIPKNTEEVPDNVDPETAKTKRARDE